MSAGQTLIEQLIDDIAVFLTWANTARVHSLELPRLLAALQQKFQRLDLETPPEVGRAGLEPATNGL